MGAEELFGKTISYKVLIFIPCAFDNNSFYYMWIKSADNKDPEARLSPKMKKHVVGAPVSTDVDFFSNASYPELKIDPSIYPLVFLNKDASDYIFGMEASVQSEFKMYYAPAAEAAEKIAWKVLCTPADKLVRGIEVIGDDAYAITYKDAKNYKLLSTSLRNVFSPL